MLTARGATVCRCTNLWLQRLRTVGERTRGSGGRPGGDLLPVPSYPWILVGDGALEHWSLQRSPVLPGQVRPATSIAHQPASAGPAPTTAENDHRSPSGLPRWFHHLQAVRGDDRQAHLGSGLMSATPPDVHPSRRLNLADPRHSKSSLSPSIITPPPATAPTLGRRRQLPTRLPPQIHLHKHTLYTPDELAYLYLRAHCAPPTDARPADRSAPRGPIPPSPAASPSPSQPARDGRRHVLPTEVRRLATPPSQAIGSLNSCCMYTDARPRLARTQLAPAPLHPHQRLAGLHLPLLRLHLLPQPALRLLLHPAAHPLPDLVQLVRPLLLRLSQRLVPPALLLFRFRRLNLSLNLTCYADVHNIYRRRRRKCYDIYPTPT